MISIKQENSKYNISLTEEYISSKSKTQLDELTKYLNNSIKIQIQNQ